MSALEYLLIWIENFGPVGIEYQKDYKELISKAYHANELLFKNYVMNCFWKTEHRSETEYRELAYGNIIGEYLSSDGKVMMALVCHNDSDSPGYSFNFMRTDKYCLLNQLDW